ncbi:hypothetical protein AYK26_01015 [Euryarchaeota archaeon SM23-78]|nr:MAG: hypothetical protein AYK26_01015 [Euryarchaeota archaeon SM23-78]MBW3001145.1 hypothetical protein [Candidatus Woesearchaeota archaeon]
MGFEKEEGGIVNSDKESPKTKNLVITKKIGADPKSSPDLTIYFKSRLLGQNKDIWDVVLESMQGRRRNVVGKLALSMLPEEEYFPKVMKDENGMRLFIHLPKTEYRIIKEEVLEQLKLKPGYETILDDKNIMSLEQKIRKELNIPKEETQTSTEPDETEAEPQIEPKKKGLSKFKGLFSKKEENKDDIFITWTFKESLLDIVDTKIVPYLKEVDKKLSEKPNENILRRLDEKTLDKLYEGFEIKVGSGYFPRKNVFKRIFNRDPSSSKTLVETIKAKVDETYVAPEKPVEKAPSTEPCYGSVPDIRLGYRLDLFKDFIESPKDTTAKEIFDGLHKDLEKNASDIALMEKGYNYLLEQKAKVKVSKFDYALFFHINLPKSLLDSTSIDTIVEFMKISRGPDEIFLPLKYSDSSKEMVKDHIKMKFTEEMPGVHLPKDYEKLEE